MFQEVRPESGRLDNFACAGFRSTLGLIVVGALRTLTSRDIFNSLEPLPDTILLASATPWLFQ